MYTSDDDVKTYVQSLLHVANITDLPAFWDDIVSRCHQKAYNTILRGLLYRGFDISTVLAWQDGLEFERDIAAWWCIVDGGMLAAIPSEMVQRLDRREELRTVPVVATVGGATAVQPSHQIGQGAMDDSNQTFKRQVTTPIPDGNTGPRDPSVTDTKW